MQEYIQGIKNKVCMKFWSEGKRKSGKRRRVNVKTRRDRKRLRKEGGGGEEKER